MEHHKIVIPDCIFRQQITAAVLFFLVTVIAGEGMIFFLCSDYKSIRMLHDYEVAGYLAQRGVDSETIVSAFTREKKAVEEKSGRKLLSAAGYNGQTESILIPDIWNLRNRYFLIMLMVAILFSGIILTVMIQREGMRNRWIDSATEQLRLFMNGNNSVRLSDCGEGSMYRLFTIINMMATSLVAHAEKEVKNKEFLKETISDISHQLKHRCLLLLCTTILFLKNEMIMKL